MRFTPWVPAALVVAGAFLAGCQVAWPGMPLTPAVKQGEYEPFLEPDAEQEPVISALRSARQTIRVHMYVLDEIDVINELKAAKKRGVDVRVMLEERLTGMGAGNKAAMSELQLAGVEVQSGNPAYPLTHLKSIVIDDAAALIMSLDQTHAAFKDNREFGIIDSNRQDVAEIVSVFEADWKRTTAPVSNPRLVWGPGDSRARLLELIDGAKQSLDIETEALQDEQILNQLLAAARRGVVVRVIMSPSRNGPDGNVPGQERLIRGSVSVKLVRVPYMHGRMVLADSARGFVGSQAFTPAELDANRELGLLTTDKRVVDGLAATFYADWNIGK